MKFHPLALCA